MARGSRALDRNIHMYIQRGGPITQTPTLEFASVL